MNTWLDDIKRALVQLGGEADLQEIYPVVKGYRSNLPEHSEAIMRREIEAHSSDSKVFKKGNDDLFYSADGIGNGRWGLR